MCYTLGGHRAASPAASRFRSRQCAAVAGIDCKGANDDEPWPLGKCGCANFHPPDRATRLASAQERFWRRVATRMAIDESRPARAPESAQVSGSTDGLRGLLAGYTGVLETIDDAPTMLWHKIERPRLMRWVRVPAPRALVRALVVRHVSRCISALKRSAASRAALADDAPGPQRDLKMLEHFEQSLPTGLRLALVWPLALLGTLLVAYVIANFVMRAVQSKLLGDLTTAAVDLNRQEAIDAFKNERLPPGSYTLAAMIIAWSVTLVIVPLLPAFSVKRRLLTQLAGLEEHGFAALGARRVYDLELDLVAQLTLVAPVALFGIAMLALPPPVPTVGVIQITVAVLACVELRARYGVRRGGTTRGHGHLSRLRQLAAWVVSIGRPRLSLVLAWLLSIGWFIFGVTQAGEEAPLAEKKVGEKVGGRELTFTVTAIQQNAACADPYRPLKAGQQFLRFDLDVSSTVDRFGNPEAANALMLRHWGVEGADGALEKDIYMYTKCGDGTEAITQPIVPGTHTKTVVVINAPKRAAFLQLKLPEYGVGWRWPIPPAGR
jgi:hypothetical protein